MTNDSVALVMPVYNEEACIEKVVNDWASCFKDLGIPFHIFVVNDGSTDKTSDKLANLKNDKITVINQKNQGHGVAIKTGYIAAVNLSNSTHIFQTDSDDQFFPEDFSMLWENRTQARFILGQRKDRKDPWYRKIISFVLRQNIMKRFDVDIPDANIPYRLIETNLLKNLLPIITPGLFAPNVFLSILAYKSGETCITIPIQHRDRNGTPAKLVSLGLIKACLQSFWDTIIFSYQVDKKVDYFNFIVNPSSVIFHGNFGLGQQNHEEDQQEEFITQKSA